MLRCMEEYGHTLFGRHFFIGGYLTDPKSSLLARQFRLEIHKLRGVRRVREVPPTAISGSLSPFETTQGYGKHIPGRQVQKTMQLQNVAKYDRCLGSLLAATGARTYTELLGQLNTLESVGLSSNCVHSCNRHGHYLHPVVCCHYWEILCPSSTRSTVAT